MIELTDTYFRCNSCYAMGGVKNITIKLVSNTSASSFRLCAKCRKQLKGLLFL